MSNDARQMSMFSGQLFKAIQSGSHSWMVGRVGLPLWTPASHKRLLSLLCDSPEVSRPRWGGVLLGAGERADSVVFSHAFLSAETRVCVRIPNGSSSYMNHRARCRHAKNLDVSHVRAVRSPPVLALEFETPGLAGR